MACGNTLVDSITLTYNTLTLEVGKDRSIQAAVCPQNADNRNVVWSSSDSSVAKVSAGGVTAVSVGTAVITATAADGSGVSAECIVTVTGGILVNQIMVSPAELELIEDGAEILSAAVYPDDADNKNVNWSTGNSDVATVNPSSGLVCAMSAGETYIYATAQDGSGVRGACHVMVVVPKYVKSITLSKAACELSRGETYTLSAEVYPADADNTDIIFSSSNTSVATVDATGVITAVSAGEAVIYASAADDSGVSASCTVTVILAEPDKETEETPVNPPENTVADPVDVYTGAHKIKSTLMSLYGGQGLKLTIHYDSAHLVEGMLGKGWYHNYEKRIEVSGDEAKVYSSPSVYSRYVIMDHPEKVVYECVSDDKGGYFLTVDDTAEYPYVIDCNSDRTEYYNADGFLARIKTHQGFVTDIEYEDSLITITDAVTGKSIYLESDGSGMVVHIRDDADRAAELVYSGGMITEIYSICDGAFTYTYDDAGRILSGTDPEGVRYFENTYDAYGRVATQKDGIEGSAKTVFTYDGNRRIVTDRNGNQSIREYNEKGLLVKYTDANGSVKTYEYDDCYNLTVEADANGNELRKSYGYFKKPDLIIDKNGNKTWYSYDSVGNLTKISYPPVNGVSAEETFEYNSRNLMTQHTDKRGTVTLYTYDASGMPASMKVGDRNAVTYRYENGLLKSKTDAMGNTTTYTHNAVGLVSSVTDADGNVTSYIYANDGSLLRTTDACGNTLYNSYDGNGQKRSESDANGNVTEYSYNGNMKTDTVILPDGNTISYGYDGEDRKVTVTDQNGNVTRTTYDAGGRAVSKRLPDGGTFRYEYDAAGNLIKETSPIGGVTLRTYDKNGNILTVTDDEGNVTAYEYDAMGRMVKKTNAVAGTTIYTYSNAGDLISETDPLGNARTYTYDAYGNMLTETDERGNVTTYAYDANNNMFELANALGQTTEYAYDCLNRCTGVRDDHGNVISYGYDALGRRTTIKDARGNVFTTVYDGNGNVLRTKDAKGNTISSTTYNSLNKPLKVLDAMGKATTYTYNALGKVESMTNALGCRTEYRYDNEGYNTLVRNAYGNTSTKSHDYMGNVVRLAGPLNGETSYSRDDMGRLISENTPSGGTVRYTYNELGLRKKHTNARGQVRQFFHDAKGRLTGITTPEGAVSYTYDACGNVLTVTDSHGIITRTYDELNRVASYTDTFGATIRYEYDSVGNLAKLIYPDNTAVTYEYDANHNLISVRDWAGRLTAYTYDVNNKVTGIRKPDGSVTTIIYDSMQRMTSTVTKDACGDIIVGFEYTYDALSRITDENVLANGTKVHYNYDNLNQVYTRTVKRVSDGEILSDDEFFRDAAGNITDTPGSCFRYDTNNKLEVFNGRHLSYDADGNMLAGNGLSCTYDSENRLTGAGGYTYTYNAEDVRISSLYDGVTTIYTYNTNCKLSQLLMKTTGCVTTKYVYGNGLIGEETNGVFKTYHFDYRGSTVALTDACGNVTDTFEYDTYGKLTGRTGTSKVIFGYNGRDGVITDDNGLIYMRARYYSPDMKRFINADVVAGDISNAVTLNRYAYANGNPVSYVDPFGLSADWGTALKIIGGIAVIAIATTVAVATAGTAVAVVAGMAATSAAVSGTVGAVVGYREDGIEGAANGFLVGSVSSAASVVVTGALGAVGAHTGFVMAGSVVVDVGELYLDDVINDGKVNETSLGDVAYTAVSGSIGFLIDTKFSKAEDELAAAAKRRDRKKYKVSDEDTRYARRTRRRANAEYNEAYEIAMWKYAGEELKGIGVGMAIDGVFNAGKAVGQYVEDNFIRSK